MPKILISEKVADETIKYLEGHDIEVKKGRGLDHQTICEDIRDCDAVMVRVMKIDRHILENARKLKVIAKHGVGCDSIDCDALEISNEYGNISADGFKAANRATIKLESGNLTLSRLETDSLNLSNEYGNCFVDEITVKQSEIAIESGNLKLQGATLGTTEITNEYGDVTLNLADKVSDYNYDLNASYGTIKLDGKTLPSDEDGTSHYQKDNGKESEIIIGSDSGNIVVR